VNLTGTFSLSQARRRLRSRPPSRTWRRATRPASAAPRSWSTGPRAP